MRLRLLLILQLITSAPLAGADRTATSLSAPQATSADPLTPEARERMQSIQGKILPPAINCWGTVLWAMGFTEGLRPATMSEFLDHLNSRACRKLEPGERVQPGDIGSLYRPDEGIYHSYIVLNEGELFEKRSPDMDRLPRTVSVREKFHLDLDLRSGCKFERDGRCRWGIVNYRCNPDQIENVKNENAGVVAKQRQRVRFLFQAMSNAFQSGSSLAAEDAYSRYVSYTESLFDGANDKPTRLLAFEAFEGLLFFSAMQGPERLSDLRYLRLNARVRSLEERAASNFSAFPETLPGQTPAYLSKK